MPSSTSNTPSPPAKCTDSTRSQGKPVSPSMFIGAVEDEWQLFSDRSSDYSLGSPIGFGASSIVYSASYQPPLTNPSCPHPPPVPCALKVLDLDSLPPHSLSLLQRETTLMSLSKHPNVLRVRGSWMDGHKLYIAMRLMNKGSAADVMRYGWPGGMEEDVIRCILRQALKGLNYLHINGFIHRDIKAANLLIDDDGTVLLGDLGVAADLAEDMSRSTTVKPHFISASAALAQPQHQTQIHTTHSSGSSHSHKRIVLFDAVPRPTMGKRKSFVGTPCWMAPELIEGRQYDSSADIWSFGITALELTQGRPPRSRESPQRVLLKTIQDAPPTLDREGGTYKYSRAFKEMVESCLIKDPSKRPTAEQLLQTPFFKSAKKKSYLVGAILKDLPPLTLRQERRAAHNPHALTHHSVDSWDFATTLHSPTTVHRRRFLEEKDSIEGEWTMGEMEEMFEMENEEGGSLEEGRRHSKAISCNDDEADESQKVEKQQKKERGLEPGTEAEMEAEAEPSSLSSPSESEFHGASLTPSLTSGSSPASSVVEDEPLPTAKPIDIGIGAASKLRSEGVSVSAPSGFSPLTSLPASSSAQTSVGATLRRMSSRGLWKTIKGASGVKEKEKEKKEQVGTGGFFSRKTAGISNRTAQTVGLSQGK